MFCAVFLILSSAFLSAVVQLPNHTRMSYEIMLSTEQLQKDNSSFWGRWIWLSDLRKQSRCCAFFTKAEVLVAHHLLGLGGVERKVVVGAPGGELLDFIPVGGLIIVVNESYYSGVPKLDENIAVSWGAVVSVQGVKQGTQHTTLGGTSAECEVWEPRQTDGVVCKEVVDLSADGIIDAQVLQLGRTWALPTL